MKSELLHEVWSSPDNSRLVSKQFSFRLPVHIAAKIAALCDMYPQKNRTQIVADLLTSALEELEKKLPYEVEPVHEFVQMELDEVNYRAQVEQSTAYEVTGPRGSFRHLSNKYYQEYEKELGSEVSITLYPSDVGRKEDVLDQLK